VTGTGNGTGNGNGNGHGDKEKIRLLVADSDQAHRALIKSMLSSYPEFDVASLVSDGERAARLAAQLQPNVAIIEIGMTRTDGSTAAESIALTAPFCQLIMLSSSNDADMFRQAMQAGAREFLVKPVTEQQLVQAIRRVYGFSVKRQAAAGAEDTARPVDRSQTGQVIAVWGPKGGVGRTFLAVNLAVSLATTLHRHVLLLDGCLGFCTADVALDIGGSKTILDLVFDREDDIDPDIIDHVVVHHSSGVDVLLAPPVESMLSIAPAHLQRILAVVRRLYDNIVIDTRPLLDETTVALLDLSDTIVTVCNPEIASLRNLRVFLDASLHLGYSADKIRLVINRFDMRGAISQTEIEKVCRYPITYSIPNDHEAVAGSINQGRPLVIHQPQRPITKEVNHLAALLVEGSNDGQVVGKRAPRLAFGRLFARGGVQP